MTDTTPTPAKLLTTARTRRGLSRTQLAAATKVPLSFIAAIEEEDSTTLPAAVFCRGFLRLLAKHLDLDHDHLLSAYNTLQQPPATASPPLSGLTVLSKLHKIAPQRKKYLLLTLVTVLFGGVVFYFLHIATPPSADSEPPTAAVVAVRPPAVTTPVPAIPPQHLRLQVMRPLQIEISIDAQSRVKRMLLPQSYEFTFTQQAWLALSDTHAVKLWFNGESVGNLARGGRQRVLVFKQAAPHTR